MSSTVITFEEFIAKLDDKVRAALEEERLCSMEDLALVPFDELRVLGLRLGDRSKIESWKRHQEAQEKLKEQQVRPQPPPPPPPVVGNEGHEQPQLGGGDAGRQRTSGTSLLPPTPPGVEDADDTNSIVLQQQPQKHRSSAPPPPPPPAVGEQPTSSAHNNAHNNNKNPSSASTTTTDARKKGLSVDSPEFRPPPPKPVTVTAGGGKAGSSVQRMSYRDVNRENYPHLQQQQQQQQQHNNNNNNIQGMTTAAVSPQLQQQLLLQQQFQQALALGAAPFQPVTYAPVMPTTTAAVPFHAPALAAPAMLPLIDGSFAAMPPPAPAAPAGTGMLMVQDPNAPPTFKPYHEALMNVPGLLLVDSTQYGSPTLMTRPLRGRHDNMTVVTICQLAPTSNPNHVVAMIQALFQVQIAVIHETEACFSVAGLPDNVEPQLQKAYPGIWSYVHRDGEDRWCVQLDETLSKMTPATLQSRLSQNGLIVNSQNIHKRHRIIRITVPQEDANKLCTRSRSMLQDRDGCFFVAFDFQANNVLLQYARWLSEPTRRDGLRDALLPCNPVVFELLHRFSGK